MIPNALAQQIDTHLESTRQREAFCLSVATGIHILLFLWNPTLLTSDWKAPHEFVEITTVEQPLAGQPLVEAPKRMSLVDTLKDMLMRPKTEEIAHIAPEPAVAKVAAPIRPKLLQEKQMSRPLNTAFQPKSAADDIAMSRTPNQIQSQM